MPYVELCKRRAGKPSGYFWISFPAAGSFYSQRALDQNQLRLKMAGFLNGSKFANVAVVSSTRKRSRGKKGQKKENRDRQFEGSQVDDD